MSEQRIKELEEGLRKLRTGLIEDGYQEINYLVELIDALLQQAPAPSTVVVKDGAENTSTPQIERGIIQAPAKTGKLQDLTEPESDTPVKVNPDGSITLLAPAKAEDCSDCKRFKSALETIAKREIKFPDYDWSDWNGEDAQSEAANLIAEYARLALLQQGPAKEGGV